MLPQSSQEDTTAPPTRTIFINPNFNKVRQQQSNDVAAAAMTTANNSTAHFNPLFLRANRPPAIHMNPQFLRKKLLEQQQLQLQRLRLLNQVKQLTPQEPCHGRVPSAVANTASTAASDRKIIAKTRTRIVREPALVEAAAMVVGKTAPQRVDPFITLSRRKLVRRIAGGAAEKVKPVDAARPVPTAIVAAKSASASGKYKIDNRRKSTTSDKAALALAKTRRRTFVARYALRRSSVAESGAAKQRVSPSVIVKPRFKFQARPASKNLQLLNINGVLYRSTRNKLQRKDVDTLPATPSLPDAASIKAKVIAKLPHGRTLFVRGTKFVMDQQGFKLTRVPAAMPPNVSKLMTDASSATTRQRIDIGGLTYIASQTQNVYVRTRNHLTLAHLNSAKQRSLHLLTRRLVKSNVPCAIFQRVGKCVAHERGKCNKVHDKRQVAVCPRFLRSECHSRDCLLSHNVSLSKMPVCKFFLQGVCVRPDCPYLHKKLSPSADICEDFLRGFCTRAAQCNKRHEFLCPEFARNGKCTLTNCAHCKSRKRQRRLSQKDVKEAKLKKVTPDSVGADDAMGVGSPVLLPLRYFSGATAKAEQPLDATVSDLDVEGTAAVVEEQMDGDLSTTATSARLSRPKVGALPAFIPLL